MLHDNDRNGRVRQNPVSLRRRPFIPDPTSLTTLDTARPAR
jgi:hypothetical protein